MKRKKWFSLLLSVVMLLSLLPTGKIAFAAGNVWDGTAANAFDGGDGSAENPYQISTAEQFKLFANIVNGADGQPKNTAACAKLTADIVLNDSKLTADADGDPLYNGGAVSDENRPEAWTPIGNNSCPYTGIFDGDGHTISGLYINNTEKMQGLFGLVEEKGKLQNTGVVNAYVRGYQYVGGVCGVNQGIITNCCNTGVITGTGMYAGGVCGFNGGTIENGSNTGVIMGSSEVGGVCGYNEETIRNSTNTGVVTGTGIYAGGVCGATYGAVTNCFNSGAVTGIEYVGGVCGGNINNPLSPGAMVQNCYSTGVVTGNKNVGGVCGYLYSSTVTNCYYLETTAHQGIGSGNGEATAQTAAQMENPAELLAKLAAGSGADVWNSECYATGDWVYGKLAVQPVFAWQTNLVKNDPTYTVTIPAEVNVGSTEPPQITVTAGALRQDQKVRVMLATDDLRMTLRDSTKTLPYQIFVNDGNTALKANDPVLQCGNTESAVTAALRFVPDKAKFSGSYTGTVTFAVSVVGEAEPSTAGIRK